MRVIFLSKRYWPAVGGVEKHLQELIFVLSRLRPDLQITVITEQHDRLLPAHENKNRVDIYRIPISSDLKKSIWMWMKSNTSLLQSADLIHVHDVFFWLLPVLPSLGKKKIFTTFHGYEPPGPPNWRQRSWHQLAEILSDGNICVGGFHQKWYGVEPTLITFGAVDPSYTKAKSRQQPASRRFLFVGRLEEDTSIWSYLEAFAQTENAKNSSFDIIGEGPLRPELEGFVQQAQLPVHFLGSRKVSVETYQQYSVSLVSGYLTILESLNAGVPVISTYSTWLKRDYLLDTPFADWIKIVAPGKELTAALERPQNFFAEAEKWAEKQTWELLAKQYLQLWNPDEKN